MKRCLKVNWYWCIKVNWYWEPQIHLLQYSNCYSKIDMMLHFYTKWYFNCRSVFSEEISWTILKRLHCLSWENFSLTSFAITLKNTLWRVTAKSVTVKSVVLNLNLAKRVTAKRVTAENVVFSLNAAGDCPWTNVLLCSITGMVHVHLCIASTISQLL